MPSGRSLCPVDYRRPDHRGGQAAATERALTATSRVGARADYEPRDDGQTILEATLAPNSAPCDLRFWSGWPDSNRRPPAPKAGALTKLRHIPWNRTVAYPPVGQAPRRRGAHMACITTVTLRGPARSRRTKPRHSALPGPARAVRPRCRETGTLSMLTRCQTQPSAGTRGRSSMAEPQPSKLVMRVRFPSPAPTQNPELKPGIEDGTGQPSRSRPLPSCPIGS